jgi:hypothetical protein
MMRLVRDTALFGKGWLDSRVRVGFKLNFEKIAGDAAGLPQGVNKEGVARLFSAADYIAISGAGALLALLRPRFAAPAPGSVWDPVPGGAAPTPGRVRLGPPPHRAPGGLPPPGSSFRPSRPRPLTPPIPAPLSPPQKQPTPPLTPGRCSPPTCSAAPRPPTARPGGTGRRSRARPSIMANSASAAGRRRGATSSRAAPTRPRRRRRCVGQGGGARATRRTGAGAGGAGLGGAGGGAERRVPCTYFPVPLSCLARPQYGTCWQFNKDMDPWKNQAVKDFMRRYYATMLSWLAQGTGPNYKVSGVFSWNLVSW